MLSEEVLTELRQRVNIVELIGASVSLKKAGSSYKGLCPFHDEKTPSFQVSPTRGRYHCFGCGAQGDAIQFIAESERLSFREAVTRLAERYQIQLPEERSVSPEERQRKREKKAWHEQLYDAQEALTQYYERQLRRSEQAQRYLRARQISEETARAFRFGWAGGDLKPFVQWMRRQECNSQLLEALGVLAPPREGRRGEEALGGLRLRFRKRLMCPIFDLRGRVVGYSGRVIDPEQKIAKYLNSPEGELFTKGDQLFGLKTALPALRKGAELILCEGNLDVAALWQAGFGGAVAAMGTALTEQQARLLRRLSNELICVMDGDAAGQKAAFKALPHLLKAGIAARSIRLPQGEDPDSLLKREGAVNFKTRLQSARPLFDHFIDAQVEGRGGDLLGRRQALLTLQPLLDQIEDQTLRKLYEVAIAERLSLPLELLSSQGVSEQQGRREEREWRGSTKRRKGSGSEKLQETLAAHLAPPKADPLGGATPAQKLLGFERQGLQLLIQYPRLLSRAQMLKIEEDFSDPRLSDFLRYLYDEWSQYQRISGTDFLNSCSDRALSAALQDCFAEPIHFASPAEQESALSELALRLKGESLKVKYRRCLQALTKHPEGSHERRALAAELAEVTEALRVLHISSSQSLSSGA